MIRFVDKRCTSLLGFGINSGDTFTVHPASACAAEVKYHFGHDGFSQARIECSAIDGGFQ
jgi:hypothetical protein